MPGLSFAVCCRPHGDGDAAGMGVSQAPESHSWHPHLWVPPGGREAGFRSCREGGRRFFLAANSIGVPAAPRDRPRGFAPRGKQRAGYARAGGRLGKWLARAALG